MDSDFIGVRAKGDKSTVRVIIDNFQLIQNPIYGDLTKGVNSSDWKNYTFNVGAWKGHKAYIEILPGEYQRHNFNLPDNAFIEAQYAISYNSEWPSEVKITNNSSTNTYSSSQISALNSKLKTGQMKAYFPELVVTIDSSKSLAKSLKSNSFIYGVTDGFAINSPVFNRGSHFEPSENSIPRRFLSALPVLSV